MNIPDEYFTDEVPTEPGVYITRDSVGVDRTLTLLDVVVDEHDTWFTTDRAPVAMVPAGAWKWLRFCRLAPAAELERVRSESDLRLDRYHDAQRLSDMRGAELDRLKAENEKLPAPSPSKSHDMETVEWPTKYEVGMRFKRKDGVEVECVAIDGDLALISAGAPAGWLGPRTGARLSYRDGGHNPCGYAEGTPSSLVAYLGKRSTPAAELDRLKAENEKLRGWVSVKKELPCEGEWVLHTYRGVKEPQYGLYTTNHFWVGSGPESVPATHWLRVPFLPTIEGGVE